MSQRRQLENFFEGRISNYRKAAISRYVLSALCLSASAVAGYLAITFSAPGTELYKTGLGLAAGFFASLIAFPINDIVTYSNSQLRDQFFLDSLSNYNTPDIPKEELERFLEIIKGG